MITAMAMRREDMYALDANTDTGEPKARREGERSESSLRASPEEGRSVMMTPDPPLSMVPDGVLPETEAELDSWQDEEERVKTRPRLTDEEQLDILQYYRESLKRGFSHTSTCRWVGQRLGRHPKTIEAFIRKMRPTVELAKLTLAANANRMLQKVIDKAPTAELIDILSRPNLGVLEPKKQESGQGGGFFLSVKAESLGAVNIGIVQKEQRHGEQELFPDTATRQPDERTGLSGGQEPVRFLSGIGAAGLPHVPADRHPVFSEGQSGEDDADSGGRHREVTDACRSQEESHQSGQSGEAERPRRPHGRFGPAGEIDYREREREEQLRLQRADEESQKRKERVRSRLRTDNKGIHLDTPHEGLEE